MADVFKQSDTPTVDHTFVDEDKVAVDLSENGPYGAPDTVRIYVETPSGQLVINDTASVVDDKNGELEYDLSENDTPEDGQYLVEWEADFGTIDGRRVKLTSPPQGYQNLSVDRTLGTVNATTLSTRDLTSDIDAGGNDVTGAGRLEADVIAGGILEDRSSGNQIDIDSLITGFASVSNDGSQVSPSAPDLNAGTGLEAVNDGDDSVTFNVTGGGTGGATDFSDGTTSLTDPTELLFTTSGAASADLTDDGDGTATLDIGAADTDTHIDVDEDGSALASDIQTLNLGSGVSGSVSGDTVTVSASGGSTSTTAPTASLVTSTGDGATSEYTLQHDLGTTAVSVIAASEAASTDFWVTSRASDTVTIKYPTARPSGEALEWIVSAGGGSTDNRYHWTEARTSYELSNANSNTKLIARVPGVPGKQWRIYRVWFDLIGSTALTADAQLILRDNSDASNELVVDGNGDPDDFAGYGIVRDDQNQLPNTLLLLGRREYPGGVNDQGVREYTVVRGAAIETAEATLDPSAENPILLETDLMPRRVRSQKIHQPPSGGTTLEVVSTDDADTMDLSVESEGGGTTDTITLTGTTSVTGSESFSDIDAAWLSAPPEGDVTIKDGSGNVLLEITGGLTYSDDDQPVDGDRGVPTLGAGSRGSAIGTSFEHFLGDRFERPSGESVAPRVNSASWAIENEINTDSLQTTRAPSVDVGNRTATVDVDIAGRFMSHDAMMEALQKVQANLEHELSGGTVTFNNTVDQSPPARTVENDQAVASEGITLAASGEPAISLSSN